MLPALFLIPVVALYRVFCAWHTSLAPVHAGGQLSNWTAGFSPLAALALCAGIFLPRRLALAVPLGVLLLSDGLIDAHYGVSLLTCTTAGHYLGLALIVAFGLWLRQRGGTRPMVLLGGTLAASAAFYLFTISFAWLGSRDYAQTLAGWIQAVTVGLPGYPPSYVFFRNGLVSDLLYSILVLACARPVAEHVPAPAGRRV